MKWILILLLSAMFFACATTRKTVANPNLKGGWVLSVFPHQKKTLAEVFGERVVYLEFNADSSMAYGNTGCNQFRTTYTAGAETLQFNPTIILTRMACPGYDEQLFLNGLKRVNRYRLNEGQLELLQGSELIMIFAKKI